MEKRHSLLRRQLKKYFGGVETLPNDILDFVNAIDDAYYEFDTDREMLERVLDLSSQELLHANAEMRAVFLALPDMLFTVNKDGVILSFKVARTDDLFLSPGENIIGKRIQDIPSRDAGNKFRDTLNQVRETNSVVSVEYSLPIQGRECFYEARMVPFIEEQTIIIVRNITERRLGEERLKEGERFMSSVFSSIQDGLSVLDEEFNIVRVNPVMEKWFAYAMPLVGKKCYKAYNRRDEFCEVCPTRKALKTGKSAHETFPRKGKDGTIKGWYELYTYPLVDVETGRMKGAIEYVRDITEKRQLENRLLNAQKMEAIGTLAGGIAHDFNNLLMGIQGYSSLMLLGTDHIDPNYEKLKNIENLVQSGADLTKQLLGFARGGAYRLKATDLNDLIKKTSSIFGRTKKEISIHTKTQENILIVEADQGQIEQVLLNLYVNAWQAMPGGGNLFLETENVTLDMEFVKPYDVRPGKYVKVSVADTGVGMDEKTIQRIFEPFFTTKEMGRGVGLGLASAYGIIKNHKGIIQAQSRRGFGATFTIYLPVSARIPVEEKTIPGEIQKGKETILLVDDEKAIIDVTRQILERLGYKVFIARSGREAIEVFKKERGSIDLVILDMVMPGIGGAETFYGLKSVDPGVRVILSSGYSINDEALEIMKEGCRAFIQKPFKIDQLSGKLREVLNG
ncbi:MAG: hybrid sensor histidine kinase/response regulator [Syntrophus sp. (in: bacteria)]|nr:hybrid sensor histidine kinase/response regulator [Syntrophus sp. (in: bacteria)]